MSLRRMSFTGLSVLVLIMDSCFKADSKESEPEKEEILNLPEVIIYKVTDITPVSAQLCYKVLFQNMVTKTYFQH